MNTSRRWIPRFVLAFVLALLLAPQLSSQEQEQEKKSRRNPNVITTEEIQSAKQTNAFSMVQALRPNWFRTRGVASMSGGDAIKVYENGMLAGGVQVLRGVSREALISMEYMDGPEATQRYGTGHAAGAILIRTGAGK